MRSAIRRLAGLCLAIFLTGWAGVAAASDVLIMSELSGGFVRSQQGVMHANGHADNAMRFRLVRLQQGRVAFQAPDGSYLGAGLGQQTLLGIGSPHIRGWETFELVNFGGASALRSVQNGRFVEVDPRSGRLSATASRYSTRSVISVVGAPPVRGGSADRHVPRQPRVEWTGRWTQIWLASPNGNLHRPPQGTRPDFTISTGRDIEMTAGCNTVHGRLRMDGRAARIERVTMTRMRCSNAAQGYEQGMAAAFDKVRSFDYREGQVAFLDSNGRTLFQIAR